MVYILELPTLTLTTEFAVNGTVTAALSLAGSLLFGISEGNSLKFMTGSGSEIVQKDTHAAPITALESVCLNGQEIVFSASTDGMLKAWTIDHNQLNFALIQSQNLQSPIHCIQILLDSNCIVSGTDSEIRVWNLNDSSLSSIPAHSSPITALQKCGNYLISGDAQGNIQVRNATSAALELQSPTGQIMSKSASPITSLCMVEEQIPIIISADQAGQMTFLTYDESTQQPFQSS